MDTLGLNKEAPPVPESKVDTAGVTSVTPVSSAEDNTKNITWEKSIPSTNKVCLIITLLLISVVDLPILRSDRRLLAFFVEMVSVFVIFMSLTILENYVLRKRFINSHSKIDYWLLSIVGSRNIIFILNCIPVIQLIGGFLLAVGTIPFLIIYPILIIKRSKVI